MKHSSFLMKLCASFVLCGMMFPVPAADPPPSVTPLPSPRVETAPPATPVSVLSDIPLQPDQAMIAALIQKGIIKPPADNLFHPGAPITRGEFTAWLFKASKLLVPFVSEFPFFRDVPTTYVYYHAVEGMRMRGVVESDDASGNFHPESPMRRGEAGVLLSRSLPKTWLELTPEEVKATLSHIQEPIPADDQYHLARSLFAGFLIPTHRYWNPGRKRQSSSAERVEMLSFDTQSPLSRMDAARMVYQRASLSEEEQPRAERQTPKLPVGLELVVSPTTAISASQLFVGQVIYFSTIDTLSVPPMQLEIPRGTRLHSKVFEIEKKTDGLHARIMFDKAILPSGDNYLLDAESFLLFKPDKNKQAVIVPGENIHIVTGTQTSP